MYLIVIMQHSDNVSVIIHFVPELSHNLLSLASSSGNILNFQEGNMTERCPRPLSEDTGGGIRKVSIYGSNGLVQYRNLFTA
jgi:hypothetical protein